MHHAMLITMVKYIHIEDVFRVSIIKDVGKCRFVTWLFSHLPPCFDPPVSFVQKPQGEHKEPSNAAQDSDKDC